ncbi:MAG: HNH endonuclease [Candidatus Aminicenantes bacterium]|nr:HNH endonuclease [Candidatus Aminicenantes bacterium]
MSIPKGFHHSKTAIEKMRLAKIGHAVNVETREKLRLASMGNKNMLGHHPTEVTRKKMSLAKQGPKGPNWKGGINHTHLGYIERLCPNHPNANSLGYVSEHRLVMESHLGRTLLPTEVVHHINGIRDDNRIENLMLFSTRGDHAFHHMKQRGKISQ